MADVSDVFYTFGAYRPDMTATEEEAETQKLVQRNGLVDAFLMEEIPADVLLDCIEEHGLDAAGYVKNIVSQIDHIKPSQLIQFDDGLGILSQGLILP